MIQIFPDKNHFLVKISQRKFFVMACQGIERNGKKLKTEINKNIKILNTPPLSLLSLLILRYKIRRNVFNQRQKILQARFVTSQ